MKKLLLLFILIANLSRAQVTVGPSDATTAPPASSSLVGRVICAGQTISVSGPDSASAYTWTKINLSGMSQTAIQKTQVYTEVTTLPGYYNYQLVIANTNGCVSPLSDLYKVYVLPALIPTITSPTTSVCSIPGNTILLTANVPAGYLYLYQWTRNGIAITGATSNNYNVVGETITGNVTFGVNVSYALNPSCTSTANKIITIVAAPIKPVVK